MWGQLGKCTAKGSSTRKVLLDFMVVTFRNIPLTRLGRLPILKDVRMGRVFLIARRVSGHSSNGAVQLSRFQSCIALSHMGLGYPKP